jgi:hypothetical protein
MTMVIFVVLFVGAVIGIFWETVATTLRQSPPEQLRAEATGSESGWPITPAHLRVW